MIRPKSIAVVIPVHSRKDMTLACLRSLFRQNVSGFQVIVVDSGSTDGTAEAVAKEFSNVTVLKYGNLWWSAATNKGVERALADHAEYIVCLNDDHEFAEDYLAAMIRAAEERPLALFGSYIFDIHTKTPIDCGARMRWASAGISKLLHTVPAEKRRGLLAITHYSGRGLWVPAKTYAQIGLFDAKRLPHYAADYDFTARAVGAGFELYMNCDAVLFNYQEQSGMLEARKHYSWRNYRRHLFGIQGGGNLRIFSIFAFRHCPRRYLPLYWSIGCLRRIGGYLRDWVLHDWSRLLNSTDRRSISKG